MSKSYFGAVGNGETVALVGPDLAVAWWCVPRPDSFPLFASALDPRRGGALRLQFRMGDTHLRVPEASVQRYMGRTNILGTSVLMEDLSVSVLDYMPWGRRALIRQITLQNLGEERQGVRVDWEVSPTRSSRAPADLEERLYVEFKGPNAALLGPGESVTTALIAAYGDSPAEAFDQWNEADPWGLETEERFWAEWLRPASPVASGDAVLDEAYYRGLLALKLLCNEHTGAILAAPTASFPAIPGGGDNWDYRYAWLRDGYFISRCLDACGLHGESRKFYDFALNCQADDGRFYQTLYTVDGGNPKEFVVDDLSGPGGERPIRFGNAASDQLQIDSEPNLIHGLWYHWVTTGDDAFIRDRWEQVRRAANAVLHTWALKENGIWEIRERVDHWVYGKALCAAGLNAAALIAQHLGRDAEAMRWFAEAGRIREDVLEKGWSAERGAYLQTYDNRSPLDISALALSLWGLLPADDPRMAATVAAMEQPFSLPPLDPDRPYSTDTPYWGLRCGGLNMGGGLARYDYAAVPFYLPTLWLARHYLRAGNRERAVELVRTCQRCATDLGLMAEHFEAKDGTQYGNFPQGFSHEEMALAILELFGEPIYPL